MALPPNPQGPTTGMTPEQRAAMMAAMAGAAGGTPVADPRAAYDAKAAALGAQSTAGRAAGPGGFGYIDPGISDPNNAIGYHRAAAANWDPGFLVDARAQAQRAAALRQGGFGSGFLPGGAGVQDLDLAVENAGDARAYQDAVSRRNIFETGGQTSEADSSRYYLGGNRDWAGNRMAEMDAMAAAMAGPSRYQGGIDKAAMHQAGAAGQLDQISGRMGGVAGQFGGVANQVGNVANQIGGAAAGQGYAGQMNSAEALYAMGQTPQGPSAAEMAMRQQAGQALQQQAAMAAMGRGANAGLAMGNAAQQGAALQGNLIGQLGQQRANEDLAYRNQRMQAMGQAGGLYGQAMGSQVNALGQQSAALGQQAGVLGAQQNAYGSQANVMGSAGDMAGKFGQTLLAAQQGDVQRDDAARQYLGISNQIAGQQLGSDMAYDAARTGNFLQDQAIKQGGKDAAAARSADLGTRIAGGLLAAGGVAATVATGGAAAPVAAPIAAAGVNQAVRGR